MFWNTVSARTHSNVFFSATGSEGIIGTTRCVFTKGIGCGHYSYSTYYYATCLWLTTLSFIAVGVVLLHHTKLGLRGRSRPELATAAVVFCAGGWLTASLVGLHTAREPLVLSTRHPKIRGYGFVNLDNYTAALDNAPGWPRPGNYLNNNHVLQTANPWFTDRDLLLNRSDSARRTNRLVRALGTGYLRELNTRAFYGGWLPNPPESRALVAVRSGYGSLTPTAHTKPFHTDLGKATAWVLERRYAWEPPGTGMNLLNWGHLVEAHYTCLREGAAHRAAHGSTGFTWKTTPPAELLQRVEALGVVGPQKFKRIVPVNAELCNFCRNRTPVGGGAVHDAVIMLDKVPAPTPHVTWIHPGGGCSRCYYLSKGCVRYLLRRTFRKWQLARLQKARLLNTKGLLMSKSPKMFYHLTTGARNRVYRKGYTNSDVFPIPNKNQFVFRTHKLGTTKTRYRHKRLHTFSTWTRLDSLDHDIAKRKAIKQKKKGYPRYAIGTGCSVHWYGWASWSLGLRQALQNKHRNTGPLFTRQVDHLVSRNAHINYFEGRPNGGGGLRSKFAFTIKLEDTQPYKNRVFANPGTTHNPQNRRQVYRSTLLWEYIHNHYNRRIINAGKSGWLAYKYRVPGLIQNKHYTPKKLSQFFNQRYKATRLMETTNYQYRHDLNNLDWVPRYDVRPPYCPCKACIGVHTTPRHPEAVGYQVPRAHQRRLYFLSLRDKHRAALLRWHDWKEYVHCTLTNPSTLPFVLKEQGVRRASDFGYTPKTAFTLNYLFSISELPMGGKGFLWTRVYEYYFSQYTHNRQLQRWKWAKHEIGNENSRFVMYHEVPSYNHEGVKQWDKFSKFSMQPIELSAPAGPCNTGHVITNSMPNSAETAPTYQNNFFKDYERVMLATRGDKRRGYKRYANRRLCHVYMIHRYSKEGHVEFFEKVWARWSSWTRWSRAYNWSIKPRATFGWPLPSKQTVVDESSRRINRPVNNFPIKSLFSHVPDYEYVRQNLGWVKSGRSKTALAAYYAHHHKFYHVVGADKPLPYPQVRRTYSPVPLWLPNCRGPAYTRTVIDGPIRNCADGDTLIKCIISDIFFALNRSDELVDCLVQFFTDLALAQAELHWTPLVSSKFKHSVGYWKYWLWDVNVWLMPLKYQKHVGPLHTLSESYIIVLRTNTLVFSCEILRNAATGTYTWGLCSTSLHIHPLRPVRWPKLTFYWIVPLIKLWLLTKLWDVLLRWLIPLDRSLFIKHRLIRKRKDYQPLMEWCMVKCGNNASFMHYSRFILPALEAPNPYWSTRVVWFDTWVDYRAIHDQFTPRPVYWWELPTKPKHMVIEFMPTDNELAERYKGYREYKRSLWDKIDAWPNPKKYIGVRYTNTTAIVIKGMGDMRYWSRVFDIKVDDPNMPKHYEKFMSWDDEEIHLRLWPNIRRIGDKRVDYPRALPSLTKPPK